MENKAHLRGIEVLRDPDVNKSTAFTAEERAQLGLRGLLPPAISTQRMQITRVLENLRRQSSDIDRYIFLRALQGRNRRLFYRTVIDHIEEIMPIIYTPTVGEACLEFAHIYRHTRALFITPDDRGDIPQLLGNWEEKDIRVIVVTDGERVLGLGDLGGNGAGIPIGKLSLYVACAGIHPEQCLPVMLDVGTENETLLDDPLYLGLRRRRLRGAEYMELLDEFVRSVQQAYPDALIQFEDFATENARASLARYRDQVLCFNDDIQGTAGVALAGVIASTRITDTPVRDLKVMFLGKGSAAAGIADLLVSSLVEEGLSAEDARSRIRFVDRKGLITRDRQDIPETLIPYAAEAEPTDFVGAIRAHRPQVLIGATGAPRTFTREIVELMTEINRRPVIFALSNPTSRAECTAEEAYAWSNGRAIFASGSPFQPVTYGGRFYRPGQGNNAYIFPGIGLGSVFSGATGVPDTMFLTAARTLADLISDADLKAGTLYPPLTRIRQISLAIATAVAERAIADGIARLGAVPEDLRSAIEAYMYDPSY
ncbi:MAG: NAD-dependent malic enzyme [Gammaproteobacteria bacterium]